MAFGALERTDPAVATPPRPRLAVAAFAFVLIAIPLSLLVPGLDLPLGVVGMMIGQTTAGLLFLRGAAQLTGKERRAWRLMGFGFLIVATGITFVATLNAVFPDIAAFGPPDLIFLTGYGAIMTGIGMLPHVTGNTTARLRVWLDGLIGAVSLAAVIWVLYLSDLVGEAAARSSLWERIAGFGYPVLDAMAMIMIMIVVVRRGSLRFDVRLLVLGAAIGTQILADLTFLSGLGENWNDATPVFAYFLMAVAGYMLAGFLVPRRPSEREYADRRSALMPMIAPYGAAVALVVLLVAHIVASPVDGLTIELLVATLIVGGLVIGRQSVAIRENRQLVERERAALVSSISHELRTPLTAMVGFLELLDDDEMMIDEAERDELTTIVHQQAVYMSRIVADLIMLARGNTSEIDLNEGPVNVRTAIESAMAAVPEAMGATDVSCPADLIVYADADRLQQVLVNLLANAIRYGGDYRAAVVRVDRDTVVIEVHDNGPGVPPRHALRIWERFERGPNRYNATNPGSGIGLAVVEAVAKAHDGSAEYERSVLLGGACFRVRLPKSRLVEQPFVPTAAEEDTSAA